MKSRFETSDDAHVWRVLLDSIPCERLSGLLSPDEMDRAGRFHFQRDRERFIARRGILRETLSSYIGGKPGDLEFEHNPFGKPSLPGKPIHFSVSHSNGVALLAISPREVGVDIEHVRSDFPFLEIAQRFFSADEIRYLDSLPASEQPRAFFSLWTRKEAYLKALGLGLGASLSTPMPLTGNVRIAGPEGSTWALTDLEVGCDFSAALASMGELTLVKLFG